MTPSVGVGELKSSRVFATLLRTGIMHHVVARSIPKTGVDVIYLPIHLAMLGMQSDPLDADVNFFLESLISPFLGMS